MTAESWKANSAAAKEEQERLLVAAATAITSDDWLVEVSIDRLPKIKPRAEFIRRWWWDNALVVVRLAPVVPEPAAYSATALTETVQEEMALRVSSGGRLRVVVEEMLPRLEIDHVARAEPALNPRRTRAEPALK